MALNISKKTSPQDVDSSAKGDLIVNNGSDIVSLPVGSNGQVLLADSNSTEGIKWADQVPMVAEVAALDNAIVRTFPGPDIVDYLYDQNGATNPNGTSIFVGTTLGASNYSAATDQNAGYNNGPPAGLLFVDLGAGNAITFTNIVINRNFGNLTVDLSNDGTNWEFVNTIGIGGANGTKTFNFVVNDSTPYRYIRITRNSGSGGGADGVDELTLYGTYTTSSINRQLLPVDLNKLNYINIGANQTYTLNIPNSSGQWSRGDYFKFVNTGEGSVLITSAGAVTVEGDLENLINFTLINLDGANHWIVVKDEAIEPAKLNTKGELLTYSTEEVALTVGSDGQILLADSSEPTGIKWAEFGGLNLTEVKYATADTIDKSSDGVFNNTKQGVFYYIGTNQETTAYTNVVTSNEVSITLDGTTSQPNAVDRSFTTFSQFFTHANSYILVDLKRDAYFELSGIGYTGGTSTDQLFRVEGSNTGVSWTSIEEVNLLASGNITPITPNSSFYRYFRITNISGNSRSWDELELFGQITSSSPIYNIQNEDNNKLVLVPFGNPTQINMPTGVGANGFICQITSTVSAALPITINPLPGVSFIGQNFTIDNIGEVATIVQASLDTYIVSISRGKLPLSAKGDLLSHDGSEPVVQPIGTDNSVLIADSTESSGIRWGDVSTIVSTPFTSQRIDLTGTLQLTSSNARYLYLDPQGNTYDVVLTNPPSVNDFFYIVNRTGNGIIQIKEIAAGGVIQTLNSVTPVCQAHYDGQEWQLLSFGTI